MQGYSIQAGERELCEVADRCAEALSLPTAAEIVADIAEDAEDESGLVPVAEALASRSRVSLEAIVVSHRAARRMPSVEAVLALDLRLAAFMARHPDFAEGVRAQLVDKDRAPRWQPGWPDAGLRTGLAAAVAGSRESALAAEG
jgi:enoyl-CoA hydratase